MGSDATEHISGSNPQISRDIKMKRKLLVIEARRWIGVKEAAQNSGPLIKMFQSVIGGSQNEPWCMSFVQYCLLHTDYIHRNLFPDWDTKHALFPSEHCLTVWKSTNLKSRLANPIMGSVVIWQYGDGNTGHAGIVDQIYQNGFSTIEGNTSYNNEREGDGVYEKRRPLGNFGHFKLCGFLDPWPSSAP